MTTNTSKQLVTKSYNIADPHNLVIRLFEHEEIDSISVPRMVHEYKVNREVLISSSDHFSRLLGGTFRESCQNTVDLHEDSAHGLTVWLQIIHGSVTEDPLTFRIEDIWFMLPVAHKYGLDPTSEAPKKWFAAWYEAHNQRIAKGDSVGWQLDFRAYQQLLLPLHTFDHAAGFLAATKFLVYHGIGHVEEKRPKGYRHDHLRLTQGVIQQLNASKGRLKTILHDPLFRPIENLARFTSCTHKKDVLFAYVKALCESEAWPLESSLRSNSMADVLRMLRRFPEPVTLESETCTDCSEDLVDVVQTARLGCEKSFDGLCLDCMNSSNPKHGDSDEDYWKHNSMKTWDRGCRVRHGQPTWYFSFMGRPEKMIQWKKQKKQRFSHHN